MTEIERLVQEHDVWRTANAINLLPSENILSPAVRKCLASDMASRYTLPINDTVHGVFIENAYRGAKFADAVVDRTKELCCEVFGSKYAVVESLSGHVAGLMAVLSLTDKDDIIMSIPAMHGGYDGYEADYIPDIMGRKALPLPFDQAAYKLDTEGSVAAIEVHKPKLVTLGASYIPFPYDLPAIRKACDDVGAFLSYDASHVMGLLAGHQFQPDAAKLCDAVHGSTHKSLFGPQGGIVLTNDKDIEKKLLYNTTWRLIDNPHLNRIAGLGQAMEELKVHGRDYAKAVIENSKALAKTLDDRGFPVLLQPDYTQSHQVLYDFDALPDLCGMDCNTLSKKFEEQGLLTDSVGRFGTAEVTRMGLGPKDMEDIAEMLVECAGGKDVRGDVEGMLGKMEMRYC